MTQPEPSSSKAEMSKGSVASENDIIDVVGDDTPSTANGNPTAERRNPTLSRLRWVKAPLTIQTLTGHITIPGWKANGVNSTSQHQDDRTSVTSLILKYNH
ncbi:hypothetical protein IWQ61_010007 [Dispira simplex]|nr:hypothetical protein IWQ61_010007 [Dispira simplex]